MTDADLLRELRKVYAEELATQWAKDSTQRTDAAMLAVARHVAEAQRESDRDYMHTAYRANPWRVPLVTDHIAGAGKVVGVDSVDSQD